VAALLTGLTTTGSNVFQSRVQPLGESKLPALLISTNEEEIETLTMHNPAVLQRRLRVQVVAKAKAVDDLDDLLDQIMQEVEVKVYENQTSYTLGGLVSGLDLESIDVEMVREGDKKFGEAVMTFNAVYFNQAGAPDVRV
jgi:hypothetical protein